MPEMKLLPCPACGSHATVQNDGYSGEEEVTGSTYVCCSNLSCSMCGPFGHDAEEAVRKWNDLPRALVWTKEAPTEPGWYWCRDYGKYIHIVHVGVDLSEYQEIRNVEWSGPIPEPHEVEHD